MTQDTRKDRRVKIVSLNVRYKSATVDEFIENHAHDVSRGGIFIKTTTPFPGGTLLKFEIRLVSDQAVIAGVGRVVWKREPATATAEHPAGMGVKFIKVDEPSKAVIDRLINSRSDAGKSYDDESDGADRTPRPGSDLAVAAMAPAPAQRTTMLGPNPSPPMESRAEPVAATRHSPPRPQKQGMFPHDDFDKETYPKQEQTVMKQAAELLEEALREAGGSMEEVGSNPLFGATGGGSRIPTQTLVSATENKPDAGTAKPTDSAPRSETERAAGIEQAAVHAKTLLGGISPAAPKQSPEAPRAPSESRRKPPGKDDRPASGR
ncbi:MAG: TIGR02266 family protein, partial [Myxococcota bacterium]|nr:TIGR02266 family protein [Myxococcota bacterium]